MMLSRIMHYRFIRYVILVSASPHSGHVAVSGPIPAFYAKIPDFYANTPCYLGL